MVDLFVYERSTSPLHRLDARVKFVLEALFVSSAMAAGPVGLAFLTALAVTGFAAGRLPALPFLGELRRFLPLFCLVFLAKFFSGSFPGSFAAFAARLLSSLCGVYVFVLMIASAHLLASTTRLMEIRASVEFFMKPFPFLNGRKAAFMLELMIGFLPLLLQKMEDIGEAGISRGSATKKGFLRPMRFIVVPLLEAVFIMSDEVTQALESRCYAGDLKAQNKKLLPSSLFPGILTAVPLILILLYRV